MGRTYGQIQIAIWDDEEFLDLSMGAQWLYMHLLTHPELKLCGVTDWRIKRIKPKAAALSLDVIEAASKELLDARFIVVDEDTEEVLIRSFVRNDGLLKMPNMGPAVAKAYSAVSSRYLRAVIVHELQRLKAERPEFPSWGALDEVLGKRSVDPFDALGQLR